MKSAKVTMVLLAIFFTVLSIYNVALGEESSVCKIGEEGCESSNEVCVNQIIGTYRAITPPMEEVFLEVREFGYFSLSGMFAGKKFESNYDYNKGGDVTFSPIEGVKCAFEEEGAVCVMNLTFKK